MELLPKFVDKGVAVEKLIKHLDLKKDKVICVGDSYNDLSMIHTADKGCLFRAPENILKEEPDLKLCTTYDEFYSVIESFVKED